MLIIMSSLSFDISIITSFLNTDRTFNNEFI
jgi:hypothetical protein